MLKNEPFKGAASRLLPLDKSKLKRVCVVGPLADSPEHMVRTFDMKLVACIRGVKLAACETAAGENQDCAECRPKPDFSPPALCSLPLQMGNYYGVWEKSAPSPLQAIKTELGAFCDLIRIPISVRTVHMHHAYSNLTNSHFNRRNRRLPGSSNVEVKTNAALKLMSINYYDWPLESALEVGDRRRRDDETI
jgi:hypothetical protein